MNVNYQPASLHVYSDMEVMIDSTVVQALDCIRRESDSMLDLLVLFESMKYQVLELAEVRSAELNLIACRSSFYEQDLYALETELLATEEISGEYKGALLLLLAMAYYRLRELDRAKEIASLARREYTACGLDECLGFNDLLLAICSIEMDEWEAAADRCVLALNEIPYRENKSTLALAWHIYGRALQKLGHREEAVAALVMSQKLYGERKESKQQVRVMLHLSNVLAGIRDWNGVVYYLKQALGICCLQAYPKLELEVLHTLGNAFKNMGRATELAGCTQRISRLMAN